MPGPQEVIASYFENTPFGAVFHDKQGKVIAANPAALEILGLSWDQLCGRDSFDLRWHAVHEDGCAYPGQTHPAMVALNEGKAVSDAVMGVFNPREQRYRWIQIQAVPQFRSGEKHPFRVFATFADITEKKALRDQLAAQNKKLEQLVEQRTREIRRERKLVEKIAQTSPAAILFLNREGTVVFVNPHAEKVLSIPRKDLIGVRYDSERWEIRDRIGRALKRQELPFEIVKKNKTPVYDIELCIHSGTDEKKMISVNAAPLLDETGGFDGVVVVITDITEKEKAARRLQISEARHRSLFEKNLAIMLLIDPHSGRILDANPAACAFYGYRYDALCHLSIWDINTLSEREVRREMCLAKTERRKRFYFDHRLASGEVRKVEVYSGPVQIDDGAQKKVVLHSIVFDITDLHHIQAALENKNKELRLLNRVIESGITGSDFEQMFSVACTELVHALGLDRAAVYLCDPLCAQLTVQSFSLAENVAPLPPSVYALDSEQALPILERLSGPVSFADLQAKGIELPKPIRQTFQKQPIRIAVVAPIRLDGRARGFLGLAAAQKREITAAELALVEKVGAQLSFALERREMAKTQRLLQAAMEQTTEGVVITDCQARIEYVNPAFEKMTEYPSAEAQGQNPRILQSGEHRLEFYRKLWDTILAGKVWKGRLKNQRKSGAHYVEDALIAPVRDRHGRITHFLGLKRDITEELEKEERLRQAQRLESLGQLAGGIAHDFNNHLATILTGTALLQSTLSEEHPAYDDIITISQTAHRASDVVRQLLAFASREYSKPQNTNLNELIIGLRIIFRRLVGKNIELVILPEANLPLVKIDRAQAEQVIFNLVVNARDAMPAGGKLTLATQRIEIDDTTRIKHEFVDPDLPDGRYALVSVTDTGVGIDPQIQPRIFDPFFTTKNKNHGTGLGLASTFGIVRQVDGHIRVSSRVGRGSTFRVYLPVTADQTIPVEKVKRSKRPVTGKEKILLVDDEENFRFFTARMLRRFGYTVTEAQSGQDALHVWKKHKGDFDLLITDIFMPNIGGYELAQKLAEISPELCIIFMSGYRESRSGQGVELKSPHRYLEKPFTPRELAGVIRQVVQQRLSQEWT